MTRLVLIAALVLSGCASAPSPWEPPPFDKIGVGMTEAQVVRRLGNTPLGREIVGGYTSRCWLLQAAGSGMLARCLLFDPSHRLVDVAGDGINDGHHVLPEPVSFDWRPPDGPVESAGRWCEQIKEAKAQTITPILLTMRSIPSDTVSVVEGRVLRMHGVEISSEDARFADLWIAPGDTLMRRPNGDFIDTYAHVSRNEDAPVGQCYVAWNPRTVAADQDRRLGFVAQTADRLKPPEGFRLLGATPVGGDWIGIAERISGGPQTLLIRTSPSGSEMVANLPFAFQAIERLIDVHGVSSSIRITGRSGGGPIRVIVFDLPPR